ncbi:hypothetical protein [Sediminibacterium sp. TEGAF015]|uniref:hypothetical protein n=1 Tax=Sediminibacterium sp. TEGAF015 TaxID=575378 RepID=UPI002205CA26|nr:hypothetical protein [Sediminibacterium sp. TEGAF015]BDQ11183.1 hypothetical protein TEGAF0_04000 [Sediminibacterium sp. TEGAF015]
MKFTQEKALMHLTGNADLSSTKMEVIEKLVHEYPFFSPGQYLFAAKLKKDDHPLVGSQAMRTALYFTNPHWLQFQLEALKDPGIDQAPKQELDTALLRSIRQKDLEWDEMINLPKIEDTLEDAEKSFVAPELPNPDISIPTIESVRELMKGIEPLDKPGTIIPVIRENTPSEPVDYTLPEVPSSEKFDPVFSALNQTEQPAPLLPEQEYSEEEYGSRTQHPDQDKSDAKIASILSSQLAEFKKPIEKETELNIEPVQDKLHTIDYFASQGIQIDLSKIPQDKLTTKLRRFTDWLKDMKNHHPNPDDLGTSPEQEKKVAETALVSNESKEILTETMAEVLAKQGQIDKAIQLYIKLSFSNPEKTAYFADKIQQLKGI